MLNLLRNSWLIIILILVSSIVCAQKKELQESIIINKNWSESITPVYNIGENSKNFEHFLFEQILNLDKVKQMPGFESASKTRFLLSTYELQHRGIVEFVRKAVEQGFKFKITVDGNLIADFEALTKKDLAELTTQQKEYYFSKYGIGTQSDIEKARQRYGLTKWCWSQLQEIRSSYSSLLTLISSPGELYPSSGLNYARIHHWKEYGIQFKVQDKWVNQKTFFPSANLTNTCLNHKHGRISSSYVNKLRYTYSPLTSWEKAFREGKITKASYEKFLNANDADKYKIAFAKTSKNKITGEPLRSGHIQFGLLFDDSQILNLFQGDQTQRWEKAYRKGLFFDAATPRKRHLPEIIFQDPKSGHQSWLRAYFSEGVKKAKADSDFVATAYNSIFGDPGNSIRVFKSSQFVATHPRLFKKIQEAIAHENFEDFFMAVDGNFSTENYSAFPSLVTSRINDDAGVPWTKAVDSNPLSFERKLQILNSMYSFDGNEGIYGGIGVKLHTKMSYIEYVDSHGIRHYVLIHGSGNFSVNAGKGNADGLILLDTTDPSLKEKITPYFEGLKNNQRMKPFLETFLQKRMAHIIKYNDLASSEIQANLIEKPTSPKNIQYNWDLINIKDGLLTSELAKLLKGSYSRREEQEKLRFILKSITVKKAGNQSAFYKNFVKLLRFYISLDAPLRFEQIYQMFYLANPQNHPYQGFIRRVSVEWLKRINDEVKRSNSQKKFKSLLKKLSRFDHPVDDIALSPLGQLIMNDCSKLYQERGLSQDFQRIKKRIK